MEEQFDICDYINMKEDEVKEVIRSIPSEDKLYNLSDLFKVFGDKTRIKVLYALSVTEMCVCDIARLVEMTQSAISHQLKTLKASKLVKYRKEGKATFYSLADDHAKTILEQGKNHIEE